MFHLLPREIESLWTLFTAPAIWVGHFLICYVAAAVACARGIDLDLVRFGIAAVTFLALSGIVFAALLAWRQWGFGTGDPPHDEPTNRSRLLFQGFATLLLCGLSFIAVVYQTLPALFIVDCRT